MKAMFPVGISTNKEGESITYENKSGRNVIVLSWT